EDEHLDHARCLEPDEAVERIAAQADDAAGNERQHLHRGEDHPRLAHVLAPRCTSSLGIGVASSWWYRSRPRWRSMPTTMKLGEMVTRPIASARRVASPGS